MNMNTYHLYGMAEGMAGVSSVEASSVEAVFTMYPNLDSVKDKIKVTGNKIGPVIPCDG